jgi:hypothetical protein
MARMTAAGIAAAMLTVLVTAACTSADSAPPAASPASPATPGSTASAGAGDTSAGSAFCVAARRFDTDQAAIDRAVALAAKGTPPAGAQATAALRPARDAQTASATMPGLAPGSLRTDVSLVVSAWKPFFAAIVHAGGEGAKVPLSAEQSLRSTVTTPRFQAAARAVSSYEARSCGLTAPHSH